MRFLACLVMVLVINACGDPPPPGPDPVDAGATEDAPAPSPPDHSDVVRPESGPPSPESEPPQPAAEPEAPRDLRQALAAIDALRDVGRFTEARQQAEQLTETSDGADRELLDERIATLRRLERQAIPVVEAIALLNGNAVERRRGRLLLLDGGQAGRILLQQAVREADIDIADEAVTLLVVLDEVDAFPALLARYMDCNDEADEQALCATLHEGLVAMAPRLDKKQLAPLPDMIRQDDEQRYPALVEILITAMSDVDLERHFGATIDRVLKDYVERAHESGDDRLIAWSLTVSDAVGLSLFQQVRVNFQTNDAPIPDDYIADYGLVKQEFDDMTFGWEKDNTDEARYRSGSHSDIRYATMNHFRNGVWSIDVPNGRFQITLVTGDPSHTDQTCHLLVNDLRLEDESGREHFMTHEFSLTVTDGQIVIKPDDDARNAKIVYLIIDPA